MLNTTAKAIVCTTISKAAESLEKEMQQEITEVSKSLVHEALKNALTGLCNGMQYSVSYILYNQINLRHVEGYCSLVMYTCTVCESLLTKFHRQPTNASTLIKVPRE